MPQQRSDLENLGSTIESIIDQAVRSKNFQKLDETIRQIVGAAVDTGSDAVRWAMDEAAKKKAVINKQDVVEERVDEPRQPRKTSQPHYQENKNIYSSTLGSQRSVPVQSNLPVLYRNTSGKLAGGIVKTVFGSIMSLFSTGGVLAGLITGLITGWGSLGVTIGGISLTVLGAGVCLLTSGIRTIGRLSRFEKYVKVLGKKTHCELQQLARAVGKPLKFVKKEIGGMIDDGLFLEGHLDEEGTSLITSDETFRHYLKTSQQRAVEKQQEATQEKRRRDESEKRKVSAQVQEVLDKGNAFLRQIRACNDAIPGEEISGKITRMETIIDKIIRRAETHPEIIPDLKKLMDYYLPMTVKLLGAYADMDSQPVQGETIMSSKREIEATLDTLNNAFEKLLDSMFRETAMDVSSDITVLQTLLAQEGLTGDEFEEIRKNRNSGQ